ncbi:ras-specific guanine nucleotide-releasing factor 2 isoform X3 [Halyomorpha halys]|uniref:ras-specific guanine nucleotide-releasing factor 2 isoform X3 n=1 Tax=Halyomorpha halys TaxID=286706 RepID=UPI0006D4DF5D
MLSPKMQRTVRVNEAQLLMLSDRAKFDNSYQGSLHKRTADSNKWQLRWFILYQNLLFYYDSESCARPSGVVMLEGCYCERLISPPSKNKDTPEKQYCFAISYRKETLRQYELRASSESECKAWIEAIREASFNKLLLQKEELEQKHLHLLQIVESERTAKLQYIQQCEELGTEIKKLRTELCALKKEWRPTKPPPPMNPPLTVQYPEDSLELRKIKKVQSFFRGWLCRRRWKQIVEQYIKSPHAESMRKRNSLVFRMVEAEEEYMEQLEVLVSCFLRPFKMAASSKKPPCSHEDVNSIFLNSETVLFLHQIFLKGLTSRMESWPTLVLGDLFDMLLPMLSIYQEYVRNHHYSLQVLTECKQSPQFANLLARLENKPACQGRSLETFLTYPMHQIPRYIITLHELLAHTPHDHVERKSLQNARQQLEDLSRQMHDEVSETENLRKNLAVERMIVEGCDILLDVNQVFVRQGSLIQLSSEKSKSSRSKAKMKSEKESIRQCFLFSNHLILATRTSGGRLHLVPEIGKVPLADATLIEDPSENETLVNEFGGRDFKIVLEGKGSSMGHQISIFLIAPTIQEKAAWISDISQCMDNVHFNDLLHSSMSDTSSVTMPQSIKNDPKLFKDDVDIRFSRTLNSCKVPQIRYATPERLLERLTDLRFLSIDFLNTFLLTYRVFTDGVTVIEALKKVFYNADPPDLQATDQFITMEGRDDMLSALHLFDPERRRSSASPRRTSGASSVSGYCSEASDRDRSHSYDSQGFPRSHWRGSYRKYEEEHMGLIKETKDTGMKLEVRRKVSIRVDQPDPSHLAIPEAIAGSSSAETLTAETNTVVSASSSPSNVSTTTLVESEMPHTETVTQQAMSHHPVTCPTQQQSTQYTDLPLPSERYLMERSGGRQTKRKSWEGGGVGGGRLPPASCDDWDEEGISAVSSRSASIVSSTAQGYYNGRRSTAGLEGEGGTPRPSFQHESPQNSSKAGVVITSFRQSQRRESSGTSLYRRLSGSSMKVGGQFFSPAEVEPKMLRSSTSTAAAAFAIATSASSNPRDNGSGPCTVSRESRPGSRRRKESVMSTAATMRVLNVLRHWVSKHAQDFEQDFKLKSLTIEFLEDIICSPNLLPAEHKAASQLLRLITKEEPAGSRVDLDKLLAIPPTPSKENIETLSALEIAEQMTYVDHQIFLSIRSEEFLGQAWMKTDKATKAPHIILMTRRFNEVSQLVVSEIVRRSNMTARIQAIEKWAAVADISRCLHNFNGVLQVCAAFTNSAVYRLKKTWEKVSKTTKQTIEKLQAIVSSDGRFRNLRDALHRCDPPCIPYLGMYLTDLSFIEEGTPNFTQDGLLNFSKMRMIAHVIREIRHFQQTPYKIEMITKVTNYLLDTSLLLDDDELYQMSLGIEPRTSRLSSITGLPTTSR